MERIGVAILVLAMVGCGSGASAQVQQDQATCQRQCVSGSCAGSYVLTPQTPSASFTADITSAKAPAHDPQWYTLDLSAFSNGGTVTITGANGMGQAGSSNYLEITCADVPASGGGFPAVQNSSDVPPGQSWSWTYKFAPPAILFLGMEGGWGSPGLTNTEAVTITVAQ